MPESRSQAPRHAETPEYLIFDEDKQLSEAEIFTAGCHGGVELVAEGFVGIVFRKIEFCRCALVLHREEKSGDQEQLTIEASMRTRQPILVAIIAMDVEPTESIHTLELTETIEWYFTGSRNELKKFGTLFFVK